jgi:hypothetical protein
MRTQGEKEMPEDSLKQRILQHFYDAPADFECSGTQTEHDSSLALENYRIFEKSEPEVARGVVLEVGESLLAFMAEMPSDDFRPGSLACEKTRTWILREFLNCHGMEEEA